MTGFMDQDFLLSTGTARDLYHGTAEGLPIIDYHCHIDPREIAEDRCFDSVTQVWLGGRRGKTVKGRAPYAGSEKAVPGI